MLFATAAGLGTGAGRREAQARRDHQDLEEEGAYGEGGDDSVRGRLQEHPAAARDTGQGQPEGQHLQEATTGNSKYRALIILSNHYSDWISLSFFTLAFESNHPMIPRLRLFVVKFGIATTLNSSNQNG